jgi:hypothetical protein
VLTQAWEVFADYDLNAVHQQKRFDRMQIAIICLGVLGTALAIIQQVFGPHVLQGDNSGSLIIYTLDDVKKVGYSLRAMDELNNRPVIWWTLSRILIIIPILLTVFITAANRFKQGNKWLLLRAGAESIKREIYRYRARAQNYKANAEAQLAARLEDITRRTMRTEVNTSSLMRYKKEQGFPPYMYAAQGGDDGFSYLTPDRYVEVRLGDQLSYFERKSIGLEKRYAMLYWATFIIGGIGAFLAAVNQQAWIALTTAIVAAIGTYMGYRQIENTLTKYNQAATDLANVKAWWNGLSADQQSQTVNIDSLVEHTEQVLQSELDGWVQQMQNALAELRRGQAPKPEPEKEEKKEPQEPPSPDDPSPTNGTDTPDNSTSTSDPSSTPAPNAEPTEGQQPGAAEEPAAEGEGSETAAESDDVESASTDGGGEGEPSTPDTSDQTAGENVDNPDATTTTGGGTVKSTN